VKPITRFTPRHGAAEVRAFAVRSDDSAWGVKQEEASIAEEDWPVVRGGEQLEDLRLRPHDDGISEAFDSVDANERSDERRDLGRGETDRAEEGQPQNGPPTPA
jgi:hypothetical protein